MKEKVLKLFNGEQADFRREVQLYSEEEDKLLEDLVQGLYLGMEESLTRIKRKLGIKKDRERPQTRQVLRENDLKRFMKKSSRALSLSKEQLEALRRPIRGVERPYRDILIYLAWKEGTFRLTDIGVYFNVGYTAAGNARSRAEEVLAKDKGLRQQVEELATLSEKI